MRDTLLKIYTWSTPNGRKITIAAEEMALRYEVIPIDIGNDEQFDPDFERISPNHKIPAIVDDGMPLMESGAILLYLADKHAKLLPSQGTAGYWRVLEWLMWQMAHFGPMLGQAHQFLHYNRGKSAFGEKRYHDEAKRLYTVLDKRLSERRYVADEFSIADIAIWPWASQFSMHEIDLNDFENVRRWYVELAERPAFERGYAIPDASKSIPMP